MCGELDETTAIAQDLLDRFAVMGRMLGLDAAAPQAGPHGLETAEGRASYMETLFRAGLTRALGDAQAAEPEETVDAIAAQAIAFARLAGFIAGQLPPEADLFRNTVEALAAGHAETARLDARWRHEQAHAHGHDHDDHHHH